MAKSKREVITRIAYGISLDNNEYYEENVAKEILLFDDYMQIAEYAKANDINFERITVHPVEVEELPDNWDNIPEVEF